MRGTYTSSNRNSNADVISFVPPDATSDDGLQNYWWDVQLLGL